MNYVSEALEQQVTAMETLLRYRQSPWLRPGVTKGEMSMWDTDLHCLHLAQPFFWNTRTVELVSQSMSLFNLEETMCSRNLVYEDCAFHWFADKVPFEIQLFDEDDKKVRMAPARAITWYFFRANKNEPYLGGTVWAPVFRDEQGEFVGPVTPALWVSIDANKPMSTQIEGSRLHFSGHVDERTAWETNQLKLFIVAASTFLRQKITPVERQLAERQTRKRLERKGWRGTQDVNVVQLRKTDRPRHEPTGDPKEVDWNWQWWVGAHTKQQWYPTLGAHLPVLIHPYIKGPADKPLKPRTTPIYSVTR